MATGFWDPCTRIGFFVKKSGLENVIILTSDPKTNALVDWKRGLLYKVTFLYDIFRASNDSGIVFGFKVPGLHDRSYSNAVVYSGVRL
jgi:hypothetical protein